MKGPHLELVETSHLETNTNPSLQAWLCLQAHQRDSSLVVLSGGTSTRQLVDALERLTCESDETHAHEHLSKQQGRQEKDHAHALSPCEVALPSVRSAFVDLGGQPLMADRAHTGAAKRRTFAVSGVMSSYRYAWPWRPARTTVCIITRLCTSHDCSTVASAIMASSAIPQRRSSTSKENTKWNYHTRVRITDLHKQLQTFSHAVESASKIHNQNQIMERVLSTNKLQTECGQTRDRKLVQTHVWQERLWTIKMLRQCLLGKISWKKQSNHVAHTLSPDQKYSKTNQGKKSTNKTKSV